MSAPLKTFFLLLFTIALSLFGVAHNNHPTFGPKPSSGTTTVLYDGSLGTLPGSQGFIYIPSPFPGSSIQTITNSVTTLNTTPVQSDKAGYFVLPNVVPILDRAKGYTVSFTSQVISETHSTNDRAGFSVIALSSDKRGIEIGFWQDKIWAQEYIAGVGNPHFIHAEEAAYNTSAALTIYDLTILGDAYTLFVGQTSILSGKLRDYSSFGAPYTTQNFIFLGDDTTSAKATLKLSDVSATTYNLDPRQVTAVADSLTASAQPVTLRQALLNNTSLAPTNLPITFDPALGLNPTITLTDFIALPTNVQILPASTCATSVTLKATFANVLQLAGNNYLRGLEILTPTGPAIKLNGLNNKFECVKVKIS